MMLLLQLSPISKTTMIFTVVLIAFVGSGGGFSFVTGSGTPESRADEFKELLELTEDKDGLESIRAIHEQLVIFYNLSINTSYSHACRLDEKNICYICMYILILCMT